MRDLHSARYPKGIVIIQPRVVPQSGKLPWGIVPQNNSPSPRQTRRVALLGIATSLVLSWEDGKSQPDSQQMKFLVSLFGYGADFDQT